MTTESIVVPKQIIILFSYEYVNLPAVHAHLAQFSSDSLSIASKNGLGRTILTSGQYPSAKPIKWTPAYNSAHLETRFDSALLFWDGSDHILKSSVEFFDKHQIPYVIVGPDAKPVAPARFYATFQNGDSTKMSAQPTVIVDAPKPAETFGQAPQKESRIRVQLYLPESAYNRYEEQAKAAKVTVEKVLSDRLRACIDHTSGRGLYFNDAERAHLERMTGGHLIMDAPTALEKIHTTVNLKVGDVTVEMNERILARCASRAKATRQNFEDFIRKEVIQGLERVVGLRPW